MVVVDIIEYSTFLVEAPRTIILIVLIRIVLRLPDDVDGLIAHVEA